MRLLFFASNECESCKKWLSAFGSEKFPPSVKGENGTEIDFVYVDAFDDSKQKFCDEHGIDELPHIKIYDSDNRIVFNKIGFFHPNKLWKVFYSSDKIRKKAYSMFDHLRPQVKSFNLSKKN